MNNENIINNISNYCEELAHLKELNNTLLQALEKLISISGDFDKAINNLLEFDPDYSINPKSVSHKIFLLLCAIEDLQEETENDINDLTKAIIEESKELQEVQK